jgi:hypothetical protein
MLPYYDRVLAPIHPVAAEHRNPYLADVVQAAAVALGVPAREGWNSAPFSDGAGFLEIGYDPETGARSSSSVAYLHPVMDARENLDVVLGHRAMRVLCDDTDDGDGARATGDRGDDARRAGRRSDPGPAVTRRARRLATTKRPDRFGEPRDH